MTNLSLTRQAGILPWSEVKATSLAIVGCGGIGSNLFHTAVAAGVEDITLIDFDEVAGENLAPGWFDAGQIGRQKVDALALMAANIGATTARLHLLDGKLGEVTLPDRTYDIIVACTDSLISRRDAVAFMWEMCAGVWFDARMGGTSSEIHIINGGGDVPEWYVETLYHEVAELPCGEKATAAVTKGIIPGRFGRVLAQMVRGVEIKEATIIEDLTYHDVVLLPR